MLLEGNNPVASNIDQLRVLREEVPALFAHRKLESEYAVYLAA